MEKVKELNDLEIIYRNKDVKKSKVKDMKKQNRWSFSKLFNKIIK